MKRMSKKFVSMIAVAVFSVAGISSLAMQSVSADSTHNSVGMHDGLLVAELYLSYGDWSSAARYTGQKPYTLAEIAIQTRIERQDGVVKTYWESAKDAWIKYDGGYNTKGANGNNYARAYGYYWSGGDKRVATKWM